MPIALDPTETHRYVLRNDRLKPESEQPALIFNFPSIRQIRKIANLFDASEEAKSVDESLGLRVDAIRVALCGWENMRDRQGNSIAYDPDRLDDILTDTDITELKKLLIKELIAAEIEKKRSAWSVLYSRENSAGDAVPPSAADPAPPNPPKSSAPPVEGTAAAPAPTAAP